MTAVPELRTTFIPTTMCLYSQGVSMTVGEGELVALLAAMAARPRRCARSWPMPRQGKINFSARHDQARCTGTVGPAGYVQGRKIFGRPSRHQKTCWWCTKRRGAWNIDGVYQLFPRLHERRTSKAGAFQAASRRCCPLRALLLNPAIILDEPSQGLKLVDRAEEV